MDLGGFCDSCEIFYINSENCEASDERDVYRRASEKLTNVEQLIESYEYSYPDGYQTLKKALRENRAKIKITSKKERLIGRFDSFENVKRDLGTKDYEILMLLNKFGENLDNLLTVYDLNQEKGILSDDYIPENQYTQSEIFNFLVNLKSDVEFQNHTQEPNWSEGLEILSNFNLIT